MTLAVIVPSRGRPGNIVELADAWQATSTDNAVLHVVVDDDDPCAPDYTRLQLPPRSTCWVIEPKRLGGALNHVAGILVGSTWSKSAPSIGFMGDDHRPRTAGWDALVGDALQTPGAVVYGNDLLQGERLPTAVFIEARVVAALNRFVLPGAQHLFLDNYWKLLGEQLGTLRYLPDVVIEHLHPVAGKAEWDEHYERNNARETWEHDEAIFNEWIACQMPHDIAHVKQALRG